MNIYKLENRVLYDAAAAADAEVADALTTAITDNTSDQSDQSDTSDSSDSSNSSVADATDGDSGSATSDLQNLIDSVLESSLIEPETGVHVLLISDAVDNASELAESASSDTIVILYDADTTTAAELLEDISNVLDGQKASSIGIIAQSDTDGDVDLLENDSDTTFWESISDYMTNDARIDFFGSDLDGSDYVDAVSSLTGHEVAYSTDTTGAEGDWLLEVGDIELEDIYFGGNAPDVTLSVEEASDTTLVVIDSAVLDADEIVDDLDSNTEILYLDADSELSGLEQINAYLEASGETYDSISIVTHGNDGYIVLTGDIIDSDYATDNADDFAELGSYLSDDGDILLYSCNTTESSSGEDFVDLIADLTGADVAASNDSTTNSDNGNWDLEYTTGIVTADALTVEGYDYHLTAYTVTSNADSGAGSLRQSVADAESGSEIVFDLTSGNEEITLSSTLTISISLTIDGNNVDGSGTNVTIAAGGSFSVIKVSSGTEDVVIENLTIKGSGTNYAAVSEGGCIYNAGELTLKNVTVTSGCAQYGGGIYNSGGLIISDSTISGNYAFGYAYSYNDPAQCYGGGIYNSGDLTISNSTISGNYAKTSVVITTGNDIEEVSINAVSYGGGIYNSGGLTISDSTISNNAAKIIFSTESSTTIGTTYLTVEVDTQTYGGGIYNSGDLTILNSTISGNSVNSETNITAKNAGGYSKVYVYIYAYGGGIFNSESLTILNSTISNNTVNLYTRVEAGGELGGCLYAYDYAYGGGIFNSESLTILNSTISGNTVNNNIDVFANSSYTYVYAYGGGIYNSGTTYLVNSIIAYNYGGSDYKDIYNYSGSITGYYCISGYDLGDTNTTYNYTDSLFASYTNGIPDLAENKGATYTVALAEDSIAIGNGCQVGTDGDGDYVYYYTDTTGDTSGWYKLSGSDATGDVTTISTDQRGETRRGSTPTAGAYYYVVYYYKSTGTNVNWSDYTTWLISETGEEGSYTAATADDEIPNADNSVEILIAAGSSVIVDTNISIDQTTIENGGSLIVSSGYTLTVADGKDTDLTVTGTLTNNGTITASDGSTVCYNGGNQTVVTMTYYELVLSGSGTTKTFTSGTTTVNTSIVISESITLDGSDANVTIAAGGDFSAIVIESGVEDVIIQDLTITGYRDSSTGTSSIDNGGGIDNSGELTLNNVTITNGYAQYGGGILNETTGTLIITNSTICDNEAYYCGGGIYNYGNLTITRSTISGNDTGSDSDYGMGGGIYNNAGTLTITNSTISGNSATTSSSFAQGGGIYNYQGNMTVTNSTISGNTATSSGGGIYLSSGTCYLLNSIIAYNYNDSDYDDIYGTVTAGYYNICGDTISGGTNVTYDYTDSTFSLFASYTDGIPDLADNGGTTETVALAANSNAIGSGCLTGTITSSGTTYYVYSSDDGSSWTELTGIVTTVSANEVTQITTDQRETTRTDSMPTPGAYYYVQHYYKSTTSGGDWNDKSTWLISVTGEEGSYTVLGNDDETPTADNSVEILIVAGATVTVTADSTGLSIDQATVESSGTLTVSSDTTLTIVDGTDTDLTVAGTLTISGTVSLSGSASISIADGSTVSYSWASAANIYNWEYYNLTISGSSVSWTDGVTVSGTLTISGMLNSDYAISSTDVSALEIPSTGILKLNVAAATLTGYTSDTFAATSGSTVIYSATDGTQTIAALTYSNLTINSSNAAITGDVTVNNTLTVTGTLSISGTVNNTTAVLTGSTVIYDWSSAASIYNWSYYNLTINCDASWTNGASVSDVLTIASGVTLTSGVTLIEDLSGNNAANTVCVISNDGTLKLTGTATLSNFDSSTLLDGIVEYAGSNTIAAISYTGTLKLSGSGTKTFAKGTTTVSTSIVISEAMTLTGSTSGSADTVITITNVGESVIVVSSSDKVTITNLTIKGYGTGGTAVSEGGCIYISGSLNLENVTVTNGYAEAGGGIYCYTGGTLTITSSEISANTATSSGGGIFLYVSTELTLDNVTVSNNHAGYGGGAIFNIGTTTITSSTIRGNTTDGSGGGIYSEGGTLNISSTTISGNTAEGEGEYVGGGGIFNETGTVTISTSTISGNEAYRGGGIYNVGEMTIISSTICGNTANFDGGGIYTYNDVYALSIISSTICGNTADVYGGGISCNGAIIYLVNSIVTYNYCSTYKNDIEYDYSSVYGYYSIYGHVSSDSLTQATHCIKYSYDGTTGHGDSLFASYTDDAAGNAIPDLADNGGTTQTVALASDSIAIGAGCMVGTYTSGSDTLYAYSADGSTWTAIIDGTTVSKEVTTITTDQIGTIRGSGYVDIGAFQLSDTAPATETDDGPLVVADTTVDVPETQYVETGFENITLTSLSNEFTNSSGTTQSGNNGNSSFSSNLTGDEGTDLFNDNDILDMDMYQNGNSDGLRNFMTPLERALMYLAG